MTWPLASFAVLAFALAAGFAWYERSHSPAKMVALVAALAALAAAGRVAFAPIPNVKPTTDIVIIAGFALGAAPGFAVGAVAALASNVIFGQGPWTPWQMLAWGLCGLLGAALGHASRHRMNRWWLAFWCALAAVGFGLIMDFSTWTTYTGAHTLEEYLAIVATSLPFTAAHAVGNVAFCLAFGPAFLRALLRYRDRFTVTWSPPPATVVGAVLVALVLAGALTQAPAARAAGSAASRATTYLKNAQNRDGGFGPEKGRASSPLFTAWTALALSAAGAPTHTLRRGTTTLSARIAADAKHVSSDGDMERTLLAAAATRTPIAALFAKLKRRQQRDGSFSGLANLTSFGILALRAGGLSASSAAVRKAGRWLAGQASDGGGYGYAGAGATPSVDDTAAALQALGRSGQEKSDAAARALDYLVRRQRADGGFGIQEGSASNAQSTAWAVQALVLYKRNPDTLRNGLSRTPLEYLRSLQQRDGSVRYSRSTVQTPTWVTAQALLAFTKRPFPISAPR